MVEKIHEFSLLLIANSIAGASLPTCAFGDVRGLVRYNRLEDNRITTGGGGGGNRGMPR